MGDSLRLSIIIFIYVFCFSQIKAQDNYRHQKDSLLAIIPELEEEAKLKAYRNLTLLPYTPTQTDTILSYFRQSITEAQKQGNIEFEKIFKINELVRLFNNSRYDTFFEKIDAYIEFFDKNKDWDKYFLAHALLVNAYENNSNNEKALEVALSMYEKSKELNNFSGQTAAAFSIASTYVSMLRRTDAEKYYLETIALGKKNSEINRYVERAYADMSFSLVEQERYDEALELLEELKGEIEKIEPSLETAEILQNRWALYYTRLIYVNIYIGNLDEAERLCDVVEEKISGNVMILSNIYANRSDIYEKRGTYQKALDAIDKAIEYSSMFLDKNYNFFAYKARILSKMGRGDEGYLIYDDLLAYKDSTNVVEINAKLDELRTIYEVDKITAENEINRQRFIIVMGICLFLLIVAGIYITYARRLKLKNNALYAQIRELTRMEKAAEEYLINTQDEKLSNEMQLFRRLSECMKTEKLFANPDMSRRKLADRLKSNETYIADAIRESTRETYSSYISNLRLHYALELLHNQPQITLDAVAIDSGHGSYSSFYRLFTKKYGITPSEYRKLSESKERK